MAATNGKGRVKVVWSWVVVMMILSAPLGAQGNATGSIWGHVTSADGVGVSDVEVTAESRSLQGKRAVTTSANGDYILPALPSGDYSLSFAKTGFLRTIEQVRLTLAETLTVSVALGLEPVSQSITVEASTRADVSRETRLVSSYQSDLVEQLPLDRSLTSTILLAPGATATGPGGTISISGAPSYEAQFLINGVVAQDNQTGQPYPLFIEDAIQETSVAVGAIPARYGRFTGGVVNAVTKSGGNRFGGSFRTTFTNDSWTALTPFPHDSRIDSTLPTYELTAGGPVLKDRLWFFLAGRHADVKSAATTYLTNLPYVAENDENRFEAKLTGTVAQGHTLKASLTDIALSQTDRASGRFLDLASLSDRTNPQQLVSASYSGVLTPRLVVEGQLSQRSFQLVGSGAKTTDLIGGTIILDQEDSNAKYHAPSSCGVCTTEQRTNYDVLGKVSYFLPTSRVGAHDLVAGGDLFNDRRFDNEHPAASDYQVFGTSVVVRGSEIDPVFNNDGTTFIRWSPVLQPTLGTNLKTYSGFLSDRWRAGDRVTVTAGFRYDRNGGTDSAGRVVVRDHEWSPRLAIAWDPRGTGTWSLNAGVAKYVAGMLVTVADSSSAGGRAASFDYVYQGPAINTDPAAPAFVNQNEALETLFNWFNANGGTNRPTRGSPSVPGLTTVIQGDLQSPDVVEETVGFAGRLGHLSLRVDGVLRSFGNFYSDRVDLTTGRVTNSIGQTFDLDVVDNSSILERRYRAVTAQLNYQRGRFAGGGHYTRSSIDGNYDAETFPGGGEANAGAQKYPQYSQSSWNTPVGALSLDQPNQARLWATYRTSMFGDAGHLDLSVLEGVDSGTPYGAVGLIDTRPFVDNPGYVNPPATVSYYFTARDAFRTATTTHTDVAANVAKKVGIGGAEIFFRATLINVFNQQGLSNAGAIDESVLTAINSRQFQAFNPFSANPLRGVNWNMGPNFGQPLTRFAYQTPRTFSFSTGVRF